MIINFKKGDIVEILPKITRNWNDKMIANIGKTFAVTGVYKERHAIGVTMEGREWTFEPEALKLIEDIAPKQTNSGILKPLDVAKLIYTPGVIIKEERITVHDSSSIVANSNDTVSLFGFLSTSLYNGLSWKEIKQTIYLGDIVYYPALNNFGKVMSFKNNQWEVRFNKDVQKSRLVEFDGLIKSHSLTTLIKKAEQDYPKGTEFFNTVDNKLLKVNGDDFDFFTSVDSYGKSIYEISTHGLIYENCRWAEVVTSSTSEHILKERYPKGTYYHCLEENGGETGFIGRANDELNLTSIGSFFKGSGCVHKDHRFARITTPIVIAENTYVNIRFRICIGASDLSKSNCDKFNSTKIQGKIGLVRFNKGDLCSVEIDGDVVLCPTICLTKTTEPVTKFKPKFLPGNLVVIKNNVPDNWTIVMTDAIGSTHVVCDRHTPPPGHIAVKLWGSYTYVFKEGNVEFSSKTEADKPKNYCTTIEPVECYKVGHYDNPLENPSPILEEENYIELKIKKVNKTKQTKKIILL